MSIPKKLGVALVCTSYLYLANLGANNLLHRREYKDLAIDTEYHCVDRPDGAFTHTEYCRSKRGKYIEDKVYKFKFLGELKVYRDGGLYGENDGLVDCIHLIPVCCGSIVLERDKNYNFNKEEFDKADKELAKAKERFKKFFENGKSNRSKP